MPKRLATAISICIQCSTCICKYRTRIRENGQKNMCLIQIKCDMMWKMKNVWLKVTKTSKFHCFNLDKMLAHSENCDWLHDSVSWKFYVEKCETDTQMIERINENEKNEMAKPCRGNYICSHCPLSSRYFFFHVISMCNIYNVSAYLFYRRKKNTKKREFCHYMGDWMS